MKRKVSKIGPATLMVSLPSKWTKKYGVKKGDELDVEEKKNYLSIKTQKSSLDLKTNNIHIKSKKLFLRRILIWHYRLGYDEIELSFDDSVPIRTIKTKLNELLGFEIVEVKANTCRLKCISQAKPEEFDATLSGIFDMTESMFEDIIYAMKNNNYNKFSDIATLESTHEKLTNFCQRILNKHGYKNEELTMYYSYIVDILEQIADQFQDMCNSISQNRIKIRKRTLEFFSEVNDLFIFLHKTFYSRNMQGVINFRERRVALTKKLYKKLINYDNRDIIVIHHMINLLDLMFHIALGIY